MPGTQDPRGLQIVDPVLTNLALNYRTGKGFAYDQIGGNMDVATKAGQYPVWSIDDFMRDDVESKVDHRAETPEIDFSYSLANYLLDTYRLKISITEEERWQAHTALRLEQSKVNGLMDRMAIRRERRLAAKLRKTTNGGQLTLGATPSVKWDATSGTIVIEKDIKAARKAVYDAIGVHVDTAIVNWDVAYVIALDPTVREILKYTSEKDSILSANGEQVIPRNFHGLNWVVVGSDKVNTARKGATRSLSSIWSDNVRLIRTVEDNAWGDPATVYKLRAPVRGTQESRARVTSSEGHTLVDRWAEADPPVDYIRAWERVEEKVVAPDLGYEIYDVLT
jgi:hypothetical protein